jgi:hypothetical protein
MVKVRTLDKYPRLCPKRGLMTRRSLAEILMMVLALCGAVAILSLIATGLLRLTARATPPGTGGIGVSVGGVTMIVFSVLIIALFAIVIALTFTLKSRR